MGCILWRYQALQVNSRFENNKGRTEGKVHQHQTNVRCCVAWAWGGIVGRRRRAWSRGRLLTPRNIAVSGGHLICLGPAEILRSRLRFTESVLFIGTQFSNLYTAVDTPAEAA